MKLVDILARDLGFWPSRMGVACQMENGRLVFSREGTKATVENTGWYISEANFGCKSRQFELAENLFYAIVTREQWQAAVDALKPIVNPTESMVLHHQEAGRITREWNGEGLPPVGTICEHKSYQISGEWREVEILAHFRNKAMVAVFIPTGDGGKKVDQAIADCFRPVRTAEQIAAEERASAIDDLIRVTCITHGEAGRIYDAGYRKQPK